MRRVALFILASLFACTGFCGTKKFVNPLTDLNWNLLFPLHVSGVRIGSGAPFQSYNKKMQVCSATKAGLPLAFWAPEMLIEVVRKPYYFPSLGGFSLSKSSSSTHHGFFDTQEGEGFYHVHVIHWPILPLLTKTLNLSSKTKAFFQDCLQGSKISISYVSELDPTWRKEGWSALLTPEMFLVNNRLAQVACASECVYLSTKGKPIPSLFWCAGCQGSVYPFVGHVTGVSSPIQASSLLVHRVLALLHRTGFGGLDRCYVGENFCGTKRVKFLPKLNYKTQLVYPVAETRGNGHPLGGSTAVWESKKSFPIQGQDFAYVVWRKRHCVLDALALAAKHYPTKGGGS